MGTNGIDKKMAKKVYDILEFGQNAKTVIKIIREVESKGGEVKMDTLKVLYGSKDNKGPKNG